LSEGHQEQSPPRGGVDYDYVLPMRVLDNVWCGQTDPYCLMTGISALLSAYIVWVRGDPGVGIIELIIISIIAATYFLTAVNTGLRLPGRTARLGMVTPLWMTSAGGDVLFNMLKTNVSRLILTKWSVFVGVWLLLIGIQLFVPNFQFNAFISVWREPNVLLNRISDVALTLSIGYMVFLTLPFSFECGFWFGFMHALAKRAQNSPEETLQLKLAARSSVFGYVRDFITALFYCVIAFAVGFAFLTILMIIGVIALTIGLSLLPIQWSPVLNSISQDPHIYIIGMLVFVAPIPALYFARKLARYYAYKVIQLNFS
jgi:hypothetical protein